ncbi:MAG: ABC transporter permease [Patescibacteria group bacterium]
MNREQLLVAFMTIFRKECIRIFRIWPQTILPSLVTSVLYFLIFGKFLSEKIGLIGDYSYIQFVIPGLVMLGVITSSYMNTAFQFFTQKFFMRSIDELLVSPMPPWVIIAGFVSGGIARGIMVGLGTLLIALLFATPVIKHFWVVFIFIFLTSMASSLAGLVNGVYAKKIDGINIVPTFVITPLVYLGGVFYSISILPPIWQTLSKINPVFYIVDGLRYGFLGVSDVSIGISISVLFVISGIFMGINWYLIRTGLGLKQ